MTKDWFEHDFSNTCSLLGLPNDPTHFLRDILARYNEGRAYHNCGHLVSVLHRIDDLVPEEERSGFEHMVARLAAYYHDVVYVPGWKLNETLSAEYAQVHLNHLAGGQAVVEPVKRAISATRDHIVSSYDGLAAQWLVDADLYELGTDRYEANGANVRAEFGDVPDHLWIAGRKRFLYTYLGRETIFYTAGQERVENKARDNMEAELGRLIRGEV